RRLCKRLRRSLKAVSELIWTATSRHVSAGSLLIQTKSKIAVIKHCSTLYAWGAIEKTSCWRTCSVSMKLGARALCVCLSSLVIFAFCLSTPSAIEAGPAAAAANGPIAAPGSSLALTADYGNLPLSFERNDGQTDAQVKFFSRGSGYSMFLTSQGAVLVLTKRTPVDGP